ncbi:MAG: glycosyltransferase family 1 protein [Lachnospiraceae bacterium]|nr:glycosyltransferase family 1 protein [Lachnospiraceae bacterium]
MSETIRILHVLGGVGLGGAESRIMDLYRQMNRDEIQFDFLVHSEAMNLYTASDTSVRKPEFYDEEIQRLGGHIYVLPKFKVYNYLTYKRAVQKFFEEHHEFQVVQGHMTSTAGIYLPIAKKCGIPVTVAHSRNAGVVKGLKGIATKFFRRNLVNKADYCFACSELAGADVFGEEAMRQGRVKIIHNAIDAGRFTYDADKRKKVREQLGMTDQLVLGHVGRFNYQKNHPYLIDIFAALCKIRQDAMLILLGEGQDMEGIKEKCRQLGIEDKVRFLGNQKRPEDYYQAMDIFLLPSFFEGLPGVLVEAQAAGLKCFVSDTITREAQATDLVTYLSIEQPAGEWAKRIHAEAAYQRRDTYQTMRDSGFDVETQASGYQLFYQKGDSSKL